ncbi:Beta-galactosidase 8 [Polyrhizophydium stewartii]|uniref:Beta-galactosidase n=1 Tax=Polyrhizophydium stewartii TaxID=2732419 RepID=A0ABR4N2G9_9FUNG
MSSSGIQRSPRATKFGSQLPRDDHTDGRRNSAAGDPTQPLIAPRPRSEGRATVFRSRMVAAVAATTAIALLAAALLPSSGGAAIGSATAVLGGMPAQAAGKSAAAPGRLSQALGGSTPGRGETSDSVPQAKVTFDSRAIVINGRREMIIAGSIHYPRSVPSTWPELLRRTKEAGINTIDTYVFWNLHEPERGQYDFSTGNANLPLFLQLARDAGLFVSLRIGPYVCAEWTYGGLPVWLRDDPSSKFRTFDTPFMTAMESFVRKTVEVIEPYLSRNGGPIIMMQMENEYGNIQTSSASDANYINWAVNLAKSIDVGVPWFMCQQDNIKTILTTCNGFYCDNWISDHRNSVPDQPAIFTELWSGWFQGVGEARPYRPAEDLAFSFARFFVRGGDYVSYYMWHGGTNFGRWRGLNIATTYDYDAPLNEYGFPHPRKYKHLQTLHNILAQYSPVMLASLPTKVYGANSQEIHTYGNTSSPNPLDSIVFLSSWDSSNSVNLAFDGVTFTLPPWSVSVVVRDTDAKHSWKVLFRTSDVVEVPQPALSLPAKAPVHISMASFALHAERPGIWNAALAVAKTSGPGEQLSITRDKADCMWSVKQVSQDLSRSNGRLYVQRAEDVMYVWINNMFLGYFGGGSSTLQQSASSIKDSLKNIRIDVRTALGTVPAGATSHQLSILTCTTGLYNYGTKFESIVKGILGKVTLGSQDLSGGTWVHQTGTLGENLKVFDPLFADDPTAPFWTPAAASSVPKNTPLTWYRATIPTQTVSTAVDSLRATAAQQIARPMLAFSLFVGTLGRGELWVNGHSVGRFDTTVKAPSSGCTSSCDYRGGFSSSKCLDGCGQPSQVFLHVPAEWVLGTGSTPAASDVQITLFDERGGDPTGMYLVPLFG